MLILLFQGEQLISTAVCSGVWDERSKGVVCLDTLVQLLQTWRWPQPVVVSGGKQCRRQGVCTACL